MSQTKSLDLGCKIHNLREIQRSCKTEFDDNEDAENLFYRCRDLAGLQKSNAVFKDCAIDYINLFKRSFAIINIAHNSSVLKVDLGCSNVRCDCFENTEASYSVLKGKQKNFKFNPRSFSAIDENA